MEQSKMVASSLMKLLLSAFHFFTLLPLQVSAVNFVEQYLKDAR